MPQDFRHATLLTLRLWSGGLCLRKPPWWIGPRTSTLLAGGMSVGSSMLRRRWIFVCASKRKDRLSPPGGISLRSGGFCSAHSASTETRSRLNQNLCKPSSMRELVGIANRQRGDDATPLQLHLDLFCSTVVLITDGTNPPSRSDCSTDISSQRWKVHVRLEGCATIPTLIVIESADLRTVAENLGKHVGFCRAMWQNKPVSTSLVLVRSSGSGRQHWQRSASAG